MKLQNRKATLQVDTVKADCTSGTGLDITFEIDKDLTSKPNSARIEVFNLTKEHREAILEKASGGADSVRVRLSAGYAENTALIYDGSIRLSYVDHVGPDVRLVLEAGDGDRLIARARINKSWAKGTTVEVVITQLVDTLGVGRGNLLEQIRGAALQGLGSSDFPGGTCASGSATRELTRLLGSCGLTWSLQDGVLQVLGPNPLDREAVLISAETGMLGSPQLDAKAKRGTLVSVQTLLIPDLFPGRKVKIESETCAGFYRVEKSRYVGDTMSDEWSITSECRAL